MRNKHWVFLMVGIFFVFSLNAVSQTKKLERVGQFPLVKIDASAPAEEIMRSLAEEHAADIRYGFDLAGFGDLYLPFMEQVKQSAYEEKDIAVGDVMQWMLFRSQGKVKVVRNLEWAGREPLPVYTFSVDKAGNHYAFVMPKACGNISLWKMEAGAPMPEIAARETPVPEEQEPQEEVEKARIYREIYDLLSETDLYCSFFVLEGDKPDTKIIGAERDYERVQFNNGDIVYIDKGRSEGVEVGQVFLVLEVGRVNTDFGPVAFKRGRVRVVALEEHASSAQVEKACGPVTVGSYLVPFESEEGWLGKDLGYDVPPYETEGLKGEIIFLQEGFFQAGSGAWALIDLGENQGLKVGQQLVVYRKLYEGVPLQVFGNVVVIDTQSRTATVKILSCKDALVQGDAVQTR